MNCNNASTYVVFDLSMFAQALRLVKINLILVS